MEPGRASWGPVRLAWAAAPRAATDPPALRETRRVLAHELATTLVADLVPDAAAFEIVRRCPHCGADDHGTPRVPGAPVVVSVAYAGAAVAVAVAPQAEAAAVGVDLERVPAAGRHAPLAELGPLFAPGAAPSLEGWTLLEAALKADGRGLRVELADCAIEQASAEASRRGSDAEYEVGVPGRTAPIAAAILPGPEGFVLSAALIPL
jgi:4'-phosphopantetheinyl transferase